MKDLIVLQVPQSLNCHKNNIDFGKQGKGIFILPLKL
jgi:hypothetical protein